MKLRIQGNSIRLRLMRSELERLGQGLVLKEEVFLAPTPDGTLRYLLSVREQSELVSVSFSQSVLDVTISPTQFDVWRQESEVGIYEKVHSDSKPLQVTIEKDFACLDRSDADNKDTFPNPLDGAVC
ncbi:MAG: hypothetical protein PW735_12975 [Acidobacteriaceae bacterium]|nr:hypothetical protein [Acidobacteriaceae bacterium]